MDLNASWGDPRGRVFGRGSGVWLGPLRKRGVDLVMLQFTGGFDLGAA